MDQVKESYLSLGVSEAVWERSQQALASLKDAFAALDAATERRSLRVLLALQRAGLTEASLGGSSGYGYDDAGRSALETAYADYFRCEAALVRSQFSSGTQVLATCLRGLLRPGDEVLIGSGMVYDTIRGTFGLDARFQGKNLGSLPDFGVQVRIIPLTAEEKLDIPAILAALTPASKMLYLQKSRGYESRRSLSSQELGEAAAAVHKLRPDLIVMADNCYGEMCDAEEPTAYGVDICAGSLIKNPGAGIANRGAYVCGKRELVDLVAQAMTAVGVGGEIGPSMGETRSLAKAFFLSPQIVREALKGAMHAAALLQAAGIPVHPGPLEERHDIVDWIQLNTPERLIAFCEEIQFASPVDASFAPIPAPMPGYDCDIIMASGSFVAGSSIELSCDGPLRPPYAAYLQGGLHFSQSRLAVMRALGRLQAMAETENGKGSACRRTQ